MYINLCQTVGSCCGGKICNSKFGTVTYSCSARIFFMPKTKPVISVLELIFLYALNVALVLLVSNAIYLITYSRYSRSHRRSSSRTVGPSQADLDFDQWFSFLRLTVNTFDRQTICVHIVWRLKYNLFFFLSNWIFSMRKRGECLNIIFPMKDRTVSCGSREQI